MHPEAIDPGVLGARLRRQVRLDDPVLGPTEPLQAEAASPLWPHHAQWALIEQTHLAEQGARRVEEYRFTPAQHAESPPRFHGPGLPVAIVFERSPNGVSSARLYATDALATARAAPLGVEPRPRASPEEDDALGHLLAALRRADAAAALAAFSADGLLQDTQGSVHRGCEALSEALRDLTAAPDPSLLCASRLDDGVHTVLELRLGGRPALLAAERDGALVSAVRLYR